MKPIIWNYVWIALALMSGFELGRGDPLTEWWWAGLVIVIASPLALREDYRSVFLR